MRRAAPLAVGLFALGPLVCWVAWKQERPRSVWADHAPTQAENMNGKYVLSATPHQNLSAFPLNYRDYPNGVEYFDIYSPLITQRYSQVFWTRLDEVPLPADVVQKFSGKAMAVVGYELDQVMKTPQGDVSLPMSVVYNHHFESTMVGAKAVLEQRPCRGQDDPACMHMGHGRPDAYSEWVVRDLEASDVPNSQAFGAANGGEVRKSFHGYAPGYAQVIQSPRAIAIEPMQIDTWNRDKMNLTGSPFVHGPAPRNSLAPTEGPDAIYSGLLECPLTTRITKVLEGAHSLALKETCAHQVASAAECYAAAKTLLQGEKFSEATGSDPTKPSGCSAVAGPKPSVYFNTAKGADCGAGTTAVQGSAKALVHVSLTVDAKKDEVSLTLAGPSDVWFGVGLGATSMSAGTYAVIVAGDQVSERVLGSHTAGTELPPSVTVVSNVVNGTTRTVVLTRALKGKTTQYFSFDVQTAALPFINAVGSSLAFAYHKAKSAASLTLLPVDGAACICGSEPAPFGQGKGSLMYEDGTMVSFGNSCPPQPRGDLLAQHNPTCDVRTYVGGQTACHHMWSLLDKDQDIPWQDQPLEYHLKMRFWYQPYDASYHKNVKRTTWGIASPVEYDVPQCAPGTKTEDCVHTITGTWKVPGGSDMKLVAAHFHCHAPTCLSVTLHYGTNASGPVICQERPVYGGHGAWEPKFDEPGYIAQPPCLWGQGFGLEAPPVVGGQQLFAVKTANSTYGHHGEMAWLQVLYEDASSQQTVDAHPWTFAAR